jgi:hypothetical protein
MISLVTDSASQIDQELAQRLEATVVPVTVVVDGEPFLERVEIADAEFYSQLIAGATVTTASPSPGQFLEAYSRCAAAGAEGIVSIHVGADWSSTLGSAELAAQESPIPVTVIDTRAVSFGVACCVWSAHDEISRGGTLGSVANAARNAIGKLAIAFFPGSPELLRRGGRLDLDTHGHDLITAWSSRADGIKELGSARQIGAIIDMMADWSWSSVGDTPVRVGISDAWIPELGDVLAEKVCSRVNVLDVVCHTLTPSVAAHMGPGSLQCTLGMRE